MDEEEADHSLFRSHKWEYFPKAASHDCYTSLKNLKIVIRFSFAKETINKVFYGNGDDGKINYWFRK